MAAGSQMDKETKKAILSVVFAIASWAAKEGLDMVPAPPFFGFILLGLAATLAWFALVQFGWFPILARKYIRYPAHAIIVLVFLLSALLMPHKKPKAPIGTNQLVVTPPSVTATTQNSPGANVVAVGTANDVTITSLLTMNPDNLSKKRRYP